MWYARLDSEGNIEVTQAAHQVRHQDLVEITDPDPELLRDPALFTVQSGVVVRRSASAIAAIRSSREQAQQNTVRVRLERLERRLGGKPNATT